MTRGRRSATRHGWLVIDKPAGWTSHDVVARVRRIVGERRVGHAGTLDPAATGVLPLAVGLATRTVEYLAQADKSYRAWIRFGVTTDSADIDGTVIDERDASGLSLDTVEELLAAFRGEILQRPPMHSAIKVGGKRLYELARRGEHVDIEERPVTIHALDVVSWDTPVLCLDITCSKGTYIRSLARDLGEAAGTGAMLERLVRTRTGPFGLDDAMSIEQLQQRIEAHGWSGTARPPEAVLGELSSLVLDSTASLEWQQGKPVPLPGNAPLTPLVRAYNANGDWIGVGKADARGRVVRPHKVIPVEQASTVTGATYRSFDQVPSGPHVVTIGTFDGVHIGHQYLLAQAGARARELGISLLTVTFEPNPAQVVRPEAFRGRLNTPEQKLALLQAAGARNILVLPFTESLMRETPEQFMRDLAGSAHAVEVWVGEAFALGHNRTGNTARLAEIGEDLGYRLQALPRREVDAEVVSSSRIRGLIEAGETAIAHRLLGYPYRVSGVVVHGAQVGRKIGFPTANVAPPPLLVPLPDGIYATLATVDGWDTPRHAMTYIGTRPTLNTGERQIETNILDFAGDLYDRVLHTDFIARLRPDSSFPDVESLIEQLGRDESAAREVLGRLPASS